MVVSGIRQWVGLVALGLAASASAQEPSAEDGESSPVPAATAAQTDNQFEPIRRGDTAPAIPPDEDGRYPMDVRGAFGRGIWFGAVDDSFSVQLRGRAQLQLAVDGTGSDVGAAARVRRLRLVLGGHVLKRLASYYIQLGFSDSGLEEDRPVPLRDAFATFHLHPSFNLRVGQMKVPFDRQRVTSSSAQQLVDRARMVRNLNLDRDVGVQIYATDLFGLDGAIAYQLGVFGGEGRNRFEPDSGLLYVARVQVSATGRFQDFRESDFERGPPRLAVAGAVAYNHRSRRQGSTQGELNAEGTTDFFHATADVFFKAYGLSLLAEGLLRHALRSDSAEAPAAAWGLLAQAGYVLPHDVELAARIAHQYPLQPSSLIEQTEIGGGITWYIIGHDLKLQVDYAAYLSPGAGTRHLGRAQVQLYF